jgi:hypothetical protein
MGAPNMVDAATFFDTLWIIESVRSDELKTGRLLYETVSDDARNSKLKVHFERPTSTSEILAALDRVRIHQSHPMLHFECHGSPSGLQAADGGLISWSELRKPLITINEGCGLNLVVVMASCNGSHLIKTATRLDKAPFWAVIGPDEEVTAGQCERDFTRFYQEFFRSFDGDKAIAALNENSTACCHPEPLYRFVNAESIFIRAFAKYYQNHCRGAGKRRRRGTSEQGNAGGQTSFLGPHTT